MRRPPASRRVFVTGPTGCGKTTLLREGFAERYARVWVQDFIGREWPHWPHAVTVETCDQLTRRLRQVVGLSRWRTVVLSEPGSELFDLSMRVLSPRPGVASFVEGVGGLALLSDEVDVMAPISASPVVRGNWQRGRHVGLTILAGTQRLAQVHRTVTAQSDVFAVFRQHEPRDLEAIAGYVPAHVMAAMRELPKFESVVYDVVAGEGYRLAGRDRGFRVLERFTNDGR